MALTRSFLQAMGIDEDKVSEIIKAHIETVDGLKSEIKTYKEAADKTGDLKKKIEDLEKAAENGENSPYKAKYEEEHTLFEKYKKKALEDQKKAMYKDLLKENGVEESRIDAIIRITNLEDMEVEDGKFKNADSMSEAIKMEWAGFIASEKTGGADVENPPATGGKQEQDLGSLSMKDYIAARSAQN